MVARLALAYLWLGIGRAPLIAMDAWLVIHDALLVIR